MGLYPAKLLAIISTFFESLQFVVTERKQTTQENKSYHFYHRASVYYKENIIPIVCDQKKHLEVNEILWIYLDETNKSKLKQVGSTQ
jgi:hypothetical protein